ncbi:MAG: hypothetical protein KJ666_10540 [Bacteroidetes bacterium]|nr:hypothetical protein [Bacteroidota bacterium]MBU2584761.1 hypothetical protein [Bacteroidota bacterium]
MNINFTDLRDGLRKSINNSITEVELTELVKLSRIIIRSYLNNIRQSVTYLCQQQGLTINDLAYECIAEVFARDGDKKFYRIEKFCNSLNDKFEKLNGTEIFLAYKSYLLTFTNSQLAQLFARNDPTGSKIHRNIRDAVKKSDMFIIQRRVSGTMLLPKSIDPFEHLPLFPIEELEREYLSNHEPKKITFLDHLQVVYDVVASQNEYSRSIPIFELVKIFKKYFAADALSEDKIGLDVNLLANGGELNSFEIEEFQLKVLAAMKEKILIKYFAKGKFNREQAEAVYFALRDIVYDWCFNGECQGSFFNYLNRYLDIEESAYNATYKAKIEYLVKLAREEFISLIDSEL